MGAGGNGARRNKALLSLLFAQRAYCRYIRGRKEAIHQDIHDDDNYPAEMIFFSVAAYARTGRGRAYAFLSLSTGEIKAKKCERVGDWRASRLEGICLEVE